MVNEKRCVSRSAIPKMYKNPGYYYVRSYSASSGDIFYILPKPPEDPPRAGKAREKKAGDTDK
jgi:hypothetical protein